MSKLVITPQMEEVLTLAMVHSQTVALKLMLEECVDKDMYLGDAGRELLEEALNDISAYKDRIASLFDDLVELEGDK